MDGSAPLADRAIAARRASGLEWERERRAGRGDLSGLMSAFALLGAPSDLVLATHRAATRSREAIVVMAPLLWLAARQGRGPSVVESPVPASPVVNGLPMYAFDKHTAIGKAAIHRLARENDAVRRALSAFVPETMARDAACMAAFHGDAAPVSRRLEWEGSVTLEALGVESDMLRAGASLTGVRPVLDAVRDNLDHLNVIRARLFTAARRSANSPS